ncbi:MAG: hypothetical protein SFX72_08050 [Isosphaeraceae bacterium]|nr:hypothetical protein [Isosphaeraceae bacterium]
MDTLGHLLRRTALAAFLALTLSGCGGSGSDVGDDGREAAARFLEDLRADRLDPAWQATNPEFKSLMGLESLRDCVRTHPALKGPAEHVEARDTDRLGGSMVEHVFRAEGLVRGKPVRSTVKVLVAYVEGKWGVEQIGVE